MSEESVQLQAEKAQAQSWGSWDGKLPFPGKKPEAGSWGSKSGRVEDSWCHKAPSQLEKGHQGMKTQFRNIDHLRWTGGGNDKISKRETRNSQSRQPCKQKFWSKWQLLLWESAPTNSIINRETILWNACNIRTLKVILKGACLSSWSYKGLPNILAWLYETKLESNEIRKDRERESKRNLIKEK